MGAAAPVSGPAWLIAAGGAAAVILLAWSLRKPVRAILRIMRKAGHLIDDFAGEDPRDGYPGRPGAMARLAAVEGKVEEIHAQFSTNGGTSLRDDTNAMKTAIQRIELAVVTLRQDVDELKGGGNG